MYNADKMHPKHKYIIAQMALDGLTTNVIDFYICTRNILEYGATAIEIGQSCGMSRQHVHNMVNILIDTGIAYRDGSRYYINKGCVKDKHLVAGMNALGYI